jgi:hypothetical protein
MVESLTIKLRLSEMPGRFAICKLAPDDEIPPETLKSDFYSITRTHEELSIVRREENMMVETGWRCIKLLGPFAFDLTGILLSVAKPLAEADIGIFAISTFDTDYVLVKEANFQKAKSALISAGHTFL